MLIRIGKYTLDVDEIKTWEYYMDSEPIKAEESAIYANFIEYIKGCGQDVTDTFNKLGIPEATYAVEIFFIGSENEESVKCAIWYHICGEILKVSEDDDMPQPIKELDIDFSETVYLADDNFPRPMIQMEVRVTVPWLLDGPNDYYCECDDIDAEYFDDEDDVNL